MRTLSFVLTILTLASCNDYKSDNGLLWQVSFDNNTSYLFGTIHSFPENENLLQQTTLEKLKDCEILVIERNILDESEQNIFLKEVKNYNFISKSYSMLNNNYDNLTSMENLLLKQSKDNDMEVIGLESSTEIIKILNELTNEDLKYNESQISLDNYKKTLNYYKSEKINEFSNKHLKNELTNNSYELLVVKRNNIWSNRIDSLYKGKSKNMFIAVGMGHLGGENGLINLLKKRGYKLKKVE